MQLCALCDDSHKLRIEDKMILYGDSVMYKYRAAQLHYRILMLHHCVNFCIKQTKKSYNFPFFMESHSLWKV